MSSLAADAPLAKDVASRVRPRAATRLDDAQPPASNGSGGAQPPPPTPRAPNVPRLATGGVDWAAVLAAPPAPRPEDEVLEAIEDLADRLDELVTAPAARRSTSDARLLSAREVARRLGVSRGKTVAALIDAGKIRTVTVNGRVRIPASEVDRIEREGFDVTRSEGRRRRRPSRIP